MENLKNLIRKIFMPSINSQYEFTLPIKSESDSDIENVENVGNIEKIFSNIASNLEYVNVLSTSKIKPFILFSFKKSIVISNTFLKYAFGYNIFLFIIYITFSLFSIYYQYGCFLSSKGQNNFYLAIIYNVYFF